jgi:mannose-6-phosphate isomerase-like protein (cupin superfamily)
VTDLAAAPLAGLTLAPAASEIVIGEWIDEPGWSSAERPPLHVHHSDDEAWYVLDGRLGLTLGDRTLEVGAGSAAIAPRGVAHTFWNASDGATC